MARVVCGIGRQPGAWPHWGGMTQNRAECRFEGSASGLEGGSGLLHVGRRSTTTTEALHGRAIDFQASDFLPTFFPFVSASLMY